MKDKVKLVISTVFGLVSIALAFLKNKKDNQTVSDKEGSSSNDGK